ncbi:hypothetical protein PENTCL1PPCAC_7638, partial [Pristionchus entomophagus]
FSMYPREDRNDSLATPIFDWPASFEFANGGSEGCSNQGAWTSPSIIELSPEDPGTEQPSANDAGPMNESTERAVVEAESAHKRRGRRKKEREKVPQCTEKCRVCGDTSTGHHYDIPSCNGCKSFFRRTLLDDRRFICEVEGNCPVLPKTRKEQKRRHCRACRFKKCVEVGMNPMAIMVEGEEDSEALQIALKRPAISHNEVPSKLISIGDYVNHLIDNLMYIEFRHQLLRRSELSPLPTNPQSILDVLSRASAMGQPQQEMNGWPLNQSHNKAVMSLEEHAQLRIPMPRLSTDRLPPSFKFWFYVDLVYAIEWAKTLDFFRRLDLADQRELICFSAWQILNVTHSYFSYVKGSDKAMFPDGKFTVWTPREADRDIITHFFRLRIDRTEYLLIKALIICNPSCETISDRARAILQKERENIAKVLFNHCMKTQGKERGPSRFCDIIALEGIMLHQASKTKQLQSLLSVLNLRSMRINLMDEI